MKVFILVGEASGDWYGSKIMEAFKQAYPSVEFAYTGGSLMSNLEGHKVLDIKEMAFMGVTEVVKNLGKIRGNFDQVKRSIKTFNPDLILCIDYPGFNLRIAQWAKANNFPVAWYIAPKVWAWKESRVKKLKRYVDDLIVIFPFEVNWFKQREIHVHYFGNPLATRITNYKRKNPQIHKNKIALLPGSRDQELRRHVPVMLDIASQNQDKEYILPLAQGYTNADLKQFNQLRELPANISVVNDAWEAMSQSHLALITSGTASLEAMLFDLPQIVVYRTSPLTYFLARHLLKLKHISLVNILAQKSVIPELYQHDVNSQKIELELSILEQKKEQIKRDYTTLTASLLSEAPFADLVNYLLNKYCQ